MPYTAKFGTFAGWLLRLALAKAKKGDFYPVTGFLQGHNSDFVAMVIHKS